VRTALTLAVADAVMTAAVLAVAMWFREVLAPAWFGVDPFLPVASYATLWPVVALIVGARAAFGLYPGHGVSDVEQLRGQTVATALVAVTVFAGGAVFRFSEAYSRFVLVLWFAGLAVALPLLRAGVRSLLARAAWFGLPVVIHGNGQGVDALRRALAERPAFGLRAARRGETAVGALVGLDDFGGTLWDDLADRYARVWVVTHDWIGALPSSVTDIDGRVALELRARLLEPVNRIAKRVLDLALTLLAAPLIAVATLAIAVAIRLDGPGPVVLRHARVGRGGREIGVLKFRTMVPDAEARLAELLAPTRRSRPSGRRSRSCGTIRASRAWAASCAPRRSTSCRRRGTCCWGR
jgi:hypothetical protein